MSCDYGPVACQFMDRQAGVISGQVIPQILHQYDTDMNKVLHGGLPTTGMEFSDNNNPYYQAILQGMQGARGSVPAPGQNYPSLIPQGVPTVPATTH